MQVADGVHQFKIPMRHNPLGYTYSYFLKEAKTLIDAGIPSRDSLAALEKQLGEQGTRVKDLERIIITHMHNDHVGLIEYIRETRQCRDRRPQDSRGTPTSPNQVVQRHVQKHLRGTPTPRRRLLPTVPKPLRTRLQGGPQAPQTRHSSSRTTRSSTSPAPS